MPHVKIELLYVDCLNSQDTDANGDKFYLIGAFTTKDTTQPTITTPIQIKKKEKKPFNPEQAILFEGNVSVGEKIKGAFENKTGEETSKDKEQLCYGNAISEFIFSYFLEILDLLLVSFE